MVLSCNCVYLNVLYICMTNPYIQRVKTHCGMRITRCCTLKVRYTPAAPGSVQKAAVMKDPRRVVTGRLAVCKKSCPGSPQ
jgi:hypothetical protein